MSNTTTVQGHGRSPATETVATLVLTEAILAEATLMHPAIGEIRNQRSRPPNIIREYIDVDLQAHREDILGALAARGHEATERSKAMATLYSYARETDRGRTVVSNLLEYQDLLHIQIGARPPVDLLIGDLPWTYLFPEYTGRYKGIFGVKPSAGKKRSKTSNLRSR